MPSNPTKDSIIGNTKTNNDRLTLTRNDFCLEEINKTPHKIKNMTIICPMIFKRINNPIGIEKNVWYCGMFVILPAMSFIGYTLRIQKYRMSQITIVKTVSAIMQHKILYFVI